MPKLMQLFRFLEAKTLLLILYADKSNYRIVAAQPKKTPNFVKLYIQISFNKYFTTIFRPPAAVLLVGTIFGTRRPVYLLCKDVSWTRSLQK